MGNTQSCSVSGINEIVDSFEKFLKLLPLQRGEELSRSDGVIRPIAMSGKVPVTGICRSSAYSVMDIPIPKFLRGPILEGNVAGWLVTIASRSHTQQVDWCVVQLIATLNKIENELGCAIKEQDNTVEELESLDAVRNHVIATMEEVSTKYSAMMVEVAIIKAKEAALIKAKAEAEAEFKQAKAEAKQANEEYDRVMQLRLTATTDAVAEQFKNACYEFGRAQLAERTAYARYNNAYWACENYYFGKN